MPISRSFTTELAIDYAWSAWSALGVSGWSAARFAACVDIEALVLLTGCLGDADDGGSFDSCLPGRRREIPGCASSFRRNQKPFPGRIC
jgi:hypothetical protein